MFAQDDHEVGVDVDHVDDDDQDDGKGRQWRAHLPMQHHTLSLCGRIDLTGSANDCVCVCVSSLVDQPVEVSSPCFCFFFCIAM